MTDIEPLAKVKKFTKKPVEIEAVLNIPENYECIDVWMESAFPEVTTEWRDDGFYIETDEGWMKANVGDWIIRGVKGEFYPCKPDIFALTYDEVPA